MRIRPYIGRLLSRGRVLLVWAMLSLLLGCSSIQVNHDYDEGFAYETLHSYAWVDTPPSVKQQPMLYNDLTDRRIKRATNQVLEARGYVQSVKEEADFLIFYHLHSDKQIQASTVYYDTGWDYDYDLFGFGFSETTLREYEQGSLVLDVLSVKEQRLIWRGLASAPVVEHKTPEERRARIVEAVNSMLEKFPPPL